MATKAEILAEAYKRGLLPADKRAAYEEAVTRGIVTDPYAKGRIYGKSSGAGKTDAVLSNLMRGTAVGDELQAAGRTAVDVLGGRVKWNTQGNALAPVGAMLGAVKKSFQDNMAYQRGVEDAGFDSGQGVRAASDIARGTGMAATSLVPGGQTTNALAAGTRVGNMARGAGAAALSAGVYAAADRGTAQERLKAAGDAMTNPVVLGLGAGAGALAPATKAAPKPKMQNALSGDIAALESIGVQPSIPQRMGGMAKNLEDQARRFPIVGDQIKGMADRQIEQLNRGPALKALEPIGVQLPKDIKPGFDTVQFVDDALSSVYDEAAGMVKTVTPEARQGFLADLEEIAQNKVDLDPSDAARFDSIIKDRLARLAKPDLDGATIKDMHSRLGIIQSEAAKKGNAVLSGMIGDVRKSLMGIIGSSSPEARALVEKADAGWSVYSVLNDAAAAASGRGGVFSPSQLNQQARASARRLGSNMAGKGKGTLQDVATAAQRVLSDQYGNPGTANALLTAGGGVGGGAALTGALGPQAQAAAAVGMVGTAAAATPYALAARRVLTQLPANASASQLQEAATTLSALADRDPAVREALSEVLARLTRSAGAAGASQAAQGASPQ